jgi:hypothetical protein
VKNAKSVLDQTDSKKRKHIVFDEVVSETPEEIMGGLTTSTPTSEVLPNREQKPQKDKSKKLKKLEE